MTVLEPNQLSQCVGFIDPAGTSTKGGRRSVEKANMAILTLCGDELGHIFVMTAWRGRLTAERFMDKIIDTYLQDHPTVFGCEGNAMQELFSSATKVVAKHRDVRLPIVPFDQPNRIEKERRIEIIMQPIINYGKLFLQKHHTQLRDEIDTFPQARLRDLIDTLASAATLLPSRTANKQKSDREEHLADYLRKAGKPAEYIQMRIAEVRREELRQRGTLH